MRTSASSPAATTRSPLRHTGLIGLAVAATSVVGLLGGVASAGAAVAPIGGTTPVSQVPSPSCQYLACPVSTAKTFYQQGYYLYAQSDFPATATGTVSYKLKCADGFTKTMSAAVKPHVYVTLTVKDEHPGGQSCTVTQTVKAGFSTTVTLDPPDSDELWGSEHVHFTNT
jgi:hypothetical protein